MKTTPSHKGLGQAAKPALWLNYGGFSELSSFTFSADLNYPSPFLRELTLG